MRQVDVIAIIAVLLMLIAVLVLNIVIRGAFYLESLNFIIDYQNNGNNSLTIFYNLVSLLVNTIVVCVFFGLLYISFPRKITVLVFLSYFLINTYMMMIMKSSFQEVRPFWYDQDIR